MKSRFVLRGLIYFSGVCAVIGDIFVSSGRKNPLKEGLKQTGLVRGLVGCLTCFANQTRRDIANAVRAVARNTNSPRKVNWKSAVDNFAFTEIILWNI